MNTTAFDVIHGRPVYINLNVCIAKWPLKIHVLKITYGSNSRWRLSVTTAARTTGLSNMEKTFGRINGFNRWRIATFPKKEVKIPRFNDPVYIVFAFINRSSELPTTFSVRGTNDLHQFVPTKSFLFLQDSGLSNFCQTRQPTRVS